MKVLSVGVKQNGKDVSFKTISQTIEHKGRTLFSILEGVESVKVDTEVHLSEWKFHLVSDISSGVYDTSPSVKTYDDSEWDTVNVPHDWSIYFPFTENSPSTYEGGFLNGGDGWYRTHLPDMSQVNGRIYLFFDGVYMESIVYINGEKVNENYWYNPFYVDITDYLDNENNVVAVFVRNRQINSRWYSGSGLFRPVSLLAVNKTSCSIRSMVITTPNIKVEYLHGRVNVNVRCDINNAENIDISGLLGLTIRDKDNIPVAETILNVEATSGNETSIGTTIPVVNPLLWGEYEGNIYTCEAVLYINGVLHGRHSDVFGFRWFDFNSNTGFSLNGIPLKIRGVCLHHDNGCLGAVASPSAINRKLEILKDMGCNAIRTSHNPASRELLTACMKKGMMVMEEFFDCWESSKKTYDYARFFNSDYENVIRSTIERDINNPSVIMWSLGNEIKSPTGNVGKKLYDCIKKYDNTRPVTWGDNTYSGSYIDVDEVIDIVGMNYKDVSINTIHASHPDWMLFGSETTSSLSSRGVYKRDDVHLQCSSYDNDKVNWGNSAAGSIKVYMNNDYLAGMFVWTGFDYIGEPTPFNKYPAKSSYFGIVDLAGFPKDIYYMYQSRWTDKPMIHILPHWNWNDGEQINVWLYSNCHSVELFKDGVSLGKKLQSEIGSSYQFNYQVSFTQGKLTAVGYDANGKEIVREDKYTAGDANKLMLSVYNKNDIDINSLAFITCTVLDENGHECHLADNMITFDVIGGNIEGVDNGNSASVEPFKGVNYRKAFNGKCLCVIKPTSSHVIVKAKSDGLNSDCISISILE